MQRLCIILFVISLFATTLLSSTVSAEVTSSGITPIRSIGRLAATNDGVYRMVNMPQGQLLSYIDYESGVQSIIPLDDQNASTQDDQVGYLNGILDEENGQSYVENLIISPSGEYLFVTMRSWNERTSIVRIDLKSGEMSLFYTAEQGMFSQIIGIDDSYVYFYADSTRDNSLTLLKMDYDGNVETIKDYSEKLGFVNYAYGDEIFIFNYLPAQQQVDRKLEISAVNVSTGEERTVTETDLAIPFYQGIEFAGGSFYMMYNEEGAAQHLARVSLSDGEMTTVKTFDQTDMRVDWVTVIDEDTLFFTYYDGGGYEVGSVNDPQYYLYDVATGEAIDYDLNFEYKTMFGVSNFDAAVTIICSTPNGYLVQNDVEQVSMRIAVDEKTDTLYKYSFEKLAFLSDDDARTSNANYESVDQSQILAQFNRV